MFAMIDYGRFPMENGNLPNRDPETGIRYGIISLHKLADWAIEEFEPVYSARCPMCGDEIGDDESPLCPECGFAAEFYDDWYADEPDAMIYDNDGYYLSLDEYNDVWILKSPHTTRKWSHCSPCAPGAAYLDGGDGFNRGLAYCLDDEWLMEGE